MENQFKKGDLLIRKGQDLIVRVISPDTYRDAFHGVVVESGSSSYNVGHSSETFGLSFFELYRRPSDFINNINTALDTLEQAFINRNEKVL